MGIENKSKALIDAILDEMAKLRPDEQENMAELKAYMKQYGVEEYLNDTRIDFSNLETIKMFAELLIIVNNTEAKRKQLGLPSMTEQQQAYREHMQDSSGKWLEDYEEVINADYLHQLAGGRNNRLNSTPLIYRLFNNVEHELLKVVFHYYQAAVCDTMANKEKLQEVEAKARPKQKRAIAEWKKRHNKSASDIKDMLKRVKQGKYYTIDINGNFDYVITKYEQDKKTGTAKENEILLPLEDISKTTEALISEWKIPAEWKITNEFELLSISLLNALLNNESIDYEQLETKNMAVMPTTAQLSSFISAGSNNNPPYRHIETLSRKSDIVKQGKIDADKIIKFLGREKYTAFIANKELIILLPNATDETRTIAGEILREVASNTISTGSTTIYDLQHYMEARNIKDKESASRAFANAIDYLRTVQFAKRVNENEHKYTFELFVKVEFDAKKTTAAIQLAPEFAEEIVKNKNTYYITGKSVFGIDARYLPYAFHFHNTILANMTMNVGKKNERIVSVSTLINNTPSFTDLSKAEKDRTTRRVMRSFDKNMDALKESGILWEYSNGAKNSEAMSYAEWKEANVHISFEPELEEINKPIREARMQYKEKQKQANNEDTILEQAKAIKRKRRKKSKGRKQ